MFQATKTWGGGHANFIKQYVSKRTSMHDLTYPSRAVSHQNLERQLADHTRQKKVCVSDQMPNSMYIYISHMRTCTLLE